MGFPFNAKPKEVEQKPAEPAASKGQEQASGSQAENTKDAELSAARPSSVFEFGPMVQVGENMFRGMCVGDNPDAIQACTWSIEPAAGKPREKKHIYRVEF